MGGDVGLGDEALVADYAGLGDVGLDGGWLPVRGMGVGLRLGPSSLVQIGQISNRSHTVRTSQVLADQIIGTTSAHYMSLILRADSSGRMLEIVVLAATGNTRLFDHLMVG